MSASLITGITGQDGSYLAEILLEEGKEVLGSVRDINTAQIIPSLRDKVRLVQMDLGDADSINKILSEHDIDEIYNFAAFSSGEGMFKQPVEIGKINGLGVAQILDSIQRIKPSIRFCQASSSEMFGNTDESPQNEQTAFRPRTPYGAAKLYAHTMIDIYRKKYNVFACSAILFNHESPRRGMNFVTRKVAHAAAAIKLGMANKLTLGTLDTRRDWGYAKDYVKAMRLMLQQKEPDDFVIATGRTHSIRELCECAFGYLGMDYREFVTVTVDDSRAPETVQLVGDAKKAKKELGWEPEVEFDDLVKMMVEAELARLKSRHCI